MYAILGLDVSNPRDLDRLFAQIKREKGKLDRDRMNQRNPRFNSRVFSTQSTQRWGNRPAQLVDS
jgi:hypothetical protein